MTQLRFPLLIMALLALLSFLQYRLWFHEGGIRHLLQLKTTLNEQFKSNEVLKKSNDDLLQEVKQLKQNPDAIEAKARDELGMIKKGEEFYQVVREP